MKQKKSQFIFSNFDSKTANQTYNDKLIPKFHYNVDLNFNNISSANSFTSILNSYFTNDEIDYIKQNHKDIVESIIDIEIYEYFDTIADKYCNRVFFIDNNYKLLEYLNKNFINTSSIKFTTKPNVYFDNGQIYFFCDDFLCYIDKNNAPIISTSSVNITSFAIFSNKIIFTTTYDKFSLYISNENKLENLQNNLTHYSVLNFNKSYGEILKIFIIKNKLYVFQKYKISYLNISSTDLIPITICELSYKIYKNTIVLNENYIYFNTTNGLFIFDGSDTKEIHTHILKNTIPSTEDYACVHNGYYYLKTTIKINNINCDAVIELSESNNPIIYKINDISYLKTINHSLAHFLIAITSDGKLLTLSNNKIYNDDRYIKFNKLTFNSTLVKHITKIKIINEGYFTLNIISDMATRKYNIEDNFEIINIDIPGHIFEFEIMSNYIFDIESIFIEVNTIEDIND